MSSTSLAPSCVPPIRPVPTRPADLACPSRCSSSAAELLCCGICTKHRLRGSDAKQLQHRAPSSISRCSPARLVSTQRPLSRTQPHERRQLSIHVWSVVVVLVRSALPAATSPASSPPPSRSRSRSPADAFELILPCLPDAPTTAGTTADLSAATTTAVGAAATGAAEGEGVSPAADGGDPSVSVGRLRSVRSRARSVVCAHL